MDFMRRLTNYTAGRVSEQLQSEQTSQPATPENINNGIASSSDLFGIAQPLNNFSELFVQKPEPSKTQVVPVNSKVSQLSERLKSLKEVKNDLINQIKDAQAEVMQASLAKDMPRQIAAQEKLKELNMRLQEINKEIEMIMNELEAMVEQELPQKGNQDFVTENLVAIGDYFSNLINGESLKRDSHIVSNSYKTIAKQDPQTNRESGWSRFVLKKQSRVVLLIPML